MDYFFLAMGWFLYFFVHSALASDRIKNSAARVPFLKKFYRLLYSVISMIGLMGLFIFQMYIPVVHMIEPSWVIRYFGLLLLVAGVMILIRSFTYYNAVAFIGLKEEAGHFIRKGILNRVRHPIYSGTILIVLGFLSIHPTMATLVSALSIFVYLPVGIYLEEQKLIRQFGQEYRQYRKEIPAIIPHIFK